MSAIEVTLVALAAWPIGAGLVSFAFSGWRGGLYGAHLIAAAGFRHVAETFRLLTITGAIELLTAHRPAQAQGLTVANDLG